MKQCKCIHRDLSLGNVLVVNADSYAVCLADFGLSRADYEPGYDMTNVDLLTLPYRPTEVTKHGGIIMVECLNGTEGVR